MKRIDSFLRLVADQGASDLHFHAGNVPIIRHEGELMPLPFRVLSEVETSRFLLELLTEEQRAEFAESQEADLVYSIEGVARFRVNIFVQSQGLGAVFRVIPNKTPTLDELNLPIAVKKLTQLANGLVLVTGPTGSGKSTTLAAIVHKINRDHAYHIVTIEDPIEYLHPHLKSTVNQREVGSDTKTFALALRAALRQAPKVILIGEMRDVDTIEIAMEAAETGHLVLSTLHTIDAAKTIDRIVGVFPKDQESQVRTRFAQSFRYVLSQRLLPKVGGGRIAVLEILKSTMRTRDYVLKGETEGRSLIDAMHDGSVDGMQTFDDELEKLWSKRVISREMALAYATNPTNLALRLSDGQNDSAPVASGDDSMLSMLE